LLSSCAFPKGDRQGFSNELGRRRAEHAVLHSPHHLDLERLTGFAIELDGHGPRGFGALCFAADFLDGFAIERLDLAGSESLSFSSI